MKGRVVEWQVLIALEGTIMLQRQSILVFRSKLLNINLLTMILNESLIIDKFFFLQLLKKTFSDSMSFSLVISFPATVSKNAQ